MFNSLMTLAQEFFADEAGATAIEYCIVAVFISSGLFVILDSIGLTLSSFFESVAAGF